MTSYVDGSPVKALIVEDSAVETMILSAMLRKFHCEITTAKNGKEAVQMFLEGKKFDIIFCDKDMPVMSGPEAIEKIRALGEIHVKIVGVSVGDNAQEAFMRVSADEFLPKPMDLDVVGAIIQEIIEKKKKNNNTV
ncbi:two-component response regulator ORR42-like [Lolium perenne]|uniref:two-component response regulator ORR42-like n=1 Tax=Lolium perenne TaxID=4522 RepID=UPI0021F65670|nr:two-component response regulator ORR42-like [Lolium perenne]